MNRLMRVLAIVNPSANKSRARNAWSSMASRLPGDLSTHIAKNAQDVQEQAMRGANEGFDVVVAAGGDGTIHHVVNGLMRSDRRDVTLGVVPLGTANDFAAGLKLSGECAAANPPWQSEITIDIGMVDSSERRRFFCNGFGAGLSAEIASRARRISRLRGRWLYAAALLQSVVFDVRWPAVSWQADDKLPRTVPMLSITAANGPRQGSFVLSPDAKFADGQFDVMLVGHLSRLGVIRYLPRLFAGKPPEDDPVIRQMRCQVFEITDSAEPLIVQLDGEMFADTADDCRHLSVRLIPARLRVLAM